MLEMHFQSRNYQVSRLSELRVMRKPPVRGVRSTFDIFVGGPMGGDLPDGAGLSMGDHLPNLVLAVKQIAKKHKQ